MKDKLQAITGGVSIALMLLFMVIGGAFAQQKNTGDMPDFKSDHEKQTWINLHPEEYKDMGGTIAGNSYRNDQLEPVRQQQFQQWSNLQQYIGQFKSQMDPDFQLVYWEDYTAASPEKQQYWQQNGKKFLLLPATFSKPVDQSNQ